MDDKFAAMNARFGAMDAKFDALRSMNRYVFLVLALIAGLGLYNATAPHFLGTLAQSTCRGAPSGRSAGPQRAN